MNGPLFFMSFVLFFIGIFAFEGDTAAAYAIGSGALATSVFFLTISIRQGLRDKELERAGRRHTPQGGFLRGAVYGLVLASVVFVGWAIVDDLFIAMLFGGPIFIVLPLVMGVATWAWRNTARPPRVPVRY